MGWGSTFIIKAEWDSAVDLEYSCSKSKTKENPQTIGAYKKTPSADGSPMFVLLDG